VTTHHRRRQQAEEWKPAEPIATTGQARRARRAARLDLLGQHDTSLQRLRGNLAIEYADAPAHADAAAATINYHLDRMEHHLDHIEAGT
jgi:hypothetical protein